MSGEEQGEVMPARPAREMVPEKDSRPLFFVFGLRTVENMCSVRMVSCEVIAY